MTIKTYITTVDPKETKIFEDEKSEILDTLGEQEETVAVQLQELFTSITEAITDSLEVESQLTIEINGSVSLKAKGGVKYLFFNAGAEADTTGGMKVVFSTTLKPKKDDQNT